MNAAFICLKYSKIMMYHYKYFSIWIYFQMYYICYGKAELSAAITTVFSVTWSFRKHDLVLKYIFLLLLLLLWKQRFFSRALDE